MIFYGSGVKRITILPLKINFETAGYSRCRIDGRRLGGKKFGAEHTMVNQLHIRSC